MVLGLDMSTRKTGYAVLEMDGTLICSGIIRTTSDNIKERMFEIYTNIEKLIKEHSIKIIALEDVPVTTHNNIKTGKELCILQGMILGLCFKNEIPFLLYNPSAWRSVIGTYDGTREGMKRDNQKRKAVEKVNELYGLDFIYNATETKTRHTDDDKAEAILIALAYIKERRD